tara:strand:- start:2996 stop:3511 length:516 start_codon:yes stop_codon:yes gene_type:complete
MNELLQAMQLIDKHSTILPEGDYLEICNHLKNAYNRRVDPVYFFDYDTFSIPEIGPTRDIFQYFSDHYFDKALCVDSDFIQGQITYLEKELLDSQPIKRVTKKVKSDVKRHYCFIHGLDTEEVDVGFSDADWCQMSKTYVAIENDFRKKYCESIAKKLEWLEESDYRLDSI